MELIHFFGRIPEIVLLFIFVILTLFVTFFVRYVNKIKPIEHELDQALKLLRPVKGPMTSNSLEQLDDEIGSLRLIDDHWKEFKETLVRVTTPQGTELVYNTRRAGEFINAESLVEHRLNLHAYQALPSIYTGLGLLGTFGSILFGLNALHVDPSSGQVAHIDAFINSLSGKFFSSIVGLGCAILFLAYEKWKLGVLENRCLKIEHHLDRLFPQRITEELLADILKHAEEQTTCFRHFSSDLSDRLKQGVSESLAPMMDRLAAAIDSMLAAADNLQQQKEESTEEVVERIVSTFQSALTQHAGDELERLAASLEGASGFTEQMTVRLNEALEQSEKMLSSQQEKSASHLNNMTDAMDKMLTTMETSNEEFVQSMRGAVSDLIEKNQEWSKEFHRQHQAGLERQFEFNDTLQKKIDATIEESLTKLSELFANHVQATEQSIATVLSRLDEWAAKTTAELMSYAGSLASQSEAMKSAGDSVTQAARELERSFNEQRAFLEEISTVAGALKDASSGLASSSDRLSVLYDSTKQGLDKIVEEVSTADDIMKELQNLLKRQQSVYSTLDESIARTLAAVSSAMREYSEHTRTSLGGYLSDFDKHLADAANQLQGTVADLDDRLGELTEVIQRNVPVASPPTR